ncbi:MAG: tyrosine-type recombinase/integrase [Desulfobacteraceae bacterium]|jgi:integrase|nr:tyrosine-type recombinase/integrase [Desulfobacteraceae bacterium]
MGVTIRQKEKGKGNPWWIFIHHNGQRKSVKVGDKRTAEREVKKIQRMLLSGQFELEQKEEHGKKFKDYAKDWLETRIKALRRASTHERYESVLRKHINPVIGNKPIDLLKRKDIRDMILKFHGQGYSDSMIRLIRDVTSGVMFQAVEDEIIQANPVTGILKNLKLEKKKSKEIESMTAEEVALFLETCEKLYPEHYTFFLCAFRTGARLGELIGMNFSDIDWNKKNIKIQRSFRRGVLSGTKTDKSRVVVMSDQLVASLKRLEIIRKKEALKAGQGEPLEIIFHRNNDYMDQKYIRRIFKRILKKSGMRDQKPHIMRHTFASLLLSNKESMVYVKEQLGHSSIETTVDIYGHLIPNSNRDAVNRLDNLHLNRTQTHADKEKAVPG